MTELFFFFKGMGKGVAVPLSVLATYIYCLYFYMVGARSYAFPCPKGADFSVDLIPWFLAKLALYAMPATSKLIDWLALTKDDLHICYFMAAKQLPSSPSSSHGLVLLFYMLLCFVLFLNKIV